MPTLPLFDSLLIAFSFPSGFTFAITSSTPACFATAFAVSALSPVSMTVYIPMFFNSLTAFAESSFIVSATAMIPSNSPSFVNNIGVFPCSEISSAFASTSPETENFPDMNSTLPPNISQPSILPVKPFPTSALKFSTSPVFASLSYSHTAFARGCSLLLSSVFA